MSQKFIVSCQMWDLTTALELYHNHDSSVISIPGFVTSATPTTSGGPTTTNTATPPQTSQGPASKPCTLVYSGGSRALQV